MSFWLVSNGHVDRQLFLIVINVWVAKLLIICKITNFFLHFFATRPKKLLFSSEVNSEGITAPSPFLFIP